MRFSFAQLYQSLIASSFFFGMGYIVGFLSPDKLSALPFAPLAIVVLSGPFWAKTIVQQEEADLEQSSSSPANQVVSVTDPRRLRQVSTEGNKYILEDMGSPVMLLSECDAEIVNPVTRRSSILKGTKAVTVAEFVKLGWNRGFSFRQMAGLPIGDGLGTEVGRTLWSRATDALHENHLIVKSPSGTTGLPHQLGFVLRHIRPSPMPDDWVGHW